MGEHGSPVFFVYPELVVSLSNHCRGVTLSPCPERVEGSSKEFTLGLVEGPSTISYRMVPGRAFRPPGAFWFLRAPLGYWRSVECRQNVKCQDSTPEPLEPLLPHLIPHDRVS